MPKVLYSPLFIHDGSVATNPYQTMAPSTTNNIHTHIDIHTGKGVKCLAQEHNNMWPARARGSNQRPSNHWTTCSSCGSPIIAPAGVYQSSLVEVLAI